ncbi:MAG: T9SS type A sorting domain-containing protein [Bacteroidales bacterium]|nr:T9SS type A sorting domain-containing protein [Bacteroidales bacterium]
MNSCKVISFLAVTCLITLPSFSQQEEIDAGIFSGMTADTLILKAKPSFTLSGQSLTNAQITVKWSQNSPVTSLQWNYSPIGLFPQGQTEISEGYRYQVYGSFGGSGINWVAGQEYVILKLVTNSPSGSCTEFLIAQDDWTQNNNGDYYMEVLGEDKTGLLYEPSVNFGSVGGNIVSDSAIYLGNSTGIMELTGYSGDIVYWERSINDGAWDILPGTAGQAQFEDVPTIEGTWSYRVKVEKPGCQPVYSAPGDITVELLAIWTGAVNNSWDDPGNWNIAGVPDENLDGLVPQTETGMYPVINGYENGKNLLIGPGASLILSKEGALTLSGYLKNDGLFSIESDTGASASLLDNGISGTGVFVSSVIYTPGLHHQISSPVIHSAKNAFGNTDLFEWNEPQNEYIPVPDDDDTLEVLKGYLAINNDQVMNPAVFEGTGLFSGIYSADFTNNGAGNGHAGGFNLAGNPYPSAMNWNDAENVTLSQVDPVLYVLNGEAGNFGTFIRGDHASSTLGIDSIIGTHQGFFVHVNHASDSGSLTVNNGARFHNPQPLRAATAARSDDPVLKLKVSGPEGSFRDEIIVRFHSEASEYFDIQYDAYDLEGFQNAPQVFTRCADTLRLAVNTYPSLDANRSVVMGFQSGEAGEFTLAVQELLNFGTDTLVFVEDLILDTTSRVTESFQYVFEGTPSDPVDRFRLHFIVDPVFEDEGIVLPEISITLAGQIIRVNFGGESQFGYFELFDLTGKRLMSQRVTGPVAMIHFPLESGMYIICIKSQKAVLVKKIIACF